MAAPLEVAARRRTKKENLLDLLSDGKWHQHGECVRAGGTRFSARVLELRADGYRIEKRHVIADLWEYKWAHEPGQMRLL